MPKANVFPISKAHPEKIGNYRWTVCVLLFFATTVNYMDRQVFGLLAPTLQSKLGWNESHYALIITVFQLAYAIGLVLFGRLVDLLGTKVGYALAIGFWSLAAMSHALNAFIPVDAKASLALLSPTYTAIPLTVLGFCVSRFALGLGESGNFPAAIKVVAEWFPKKERSLATGIFNSGANIGAMIAPILVPVMTLHCGGWPASFIMLGIVDLVWLVFWLFLFDSPEKSQRLDKAELDYIQKEKEMPVKEAISWGQLFRYRQTWAYAMQSLIISPVWWFYLFWLPKFLNSEYHLDIKAAGYPLVLIYTSTCVGSIGGGWLSSNFLRRGWSVNSARKTALLICAFCTVPVIFATRVHNVWAASILFALAASAHQGWSANAYTTVSDLFPKKAVASVTGLGGMFGSVSAMAVSLWVGAILDETGRYDNILLGCGSAYLLALLAFHLLSPRMEPAKME